VSSLIGYLTWLHFGEKASEPINDEIRMSYQLYADQITIAIQNAQRTKQLEIELEREETDLKNKLQKDYNQAQKSASDFYKLTLGVSIASIIAIFAALAISVFSIMNQQPDLLPISFVSLLLGVLVEVSSIFAFQRVDRANKRMDKYHKESFDIRLLNILLKSSEQLDNELGQQTKGNIISKASEFWFKDDVHDNSPTSSYTDTQP